MHSLDVYPSTSDCGFARESPVLDLVVNARMRYQIGGTPTHYFSGIAVCAVGAVWAADGIPEAQAHEVEIAVKEPCEIEAWMSDNAKAAMKLLDEATTELYPETSDCPGYLGPLECLNQTPYAGESFATNKYRVLRVYDLVIERLKEEQESSESLDLELAAV